MLLQIGFILGLVGEVQKPISTYYSTVCSCFLAMFAISVWVAQELLYREAALILRVGNTRYCVFLLCNMLGFSVGFKSDVQGKQSVCSADTVKYLRGYRVL